VTVGLGSVVGWIAEDSYTNLNRVPIVRFDGKYILRPDRSRIGYLDGQYVRDARGECVARFYGGYIRNLQDAPIVKIEGTPSLKQSLVILYLVVFAK
jgi:hypothetical protein